MWSYCTLSSVPTWSCLWKCELISELILVLFAFGKSSTIETLKSSLRCFSGWSWTTRWQFPIYKQGLSLPVRSCPAAVSSTVEARICPCMLSATQTSCGAANKSGFGPVTYQDIQLCTFKWQQKKFSWAPRRVLHTKLRPYWKERFSMLHLTHPEFYEEESVLGPLPKQFL